MENAPEGPVHLPTTLYKDQKLLYIHPQLSCKNLQLWYNLLQNDDSAADGGIFVLFTALNAIFQRNSILLEAVLAEDSLLQYNKSWKSVDL